MACLHASLQSGHLTLLAIPKCFYSRGTRHRVCEWDEESAKLPFARQGKAPLKAEIQPEPTSRRSVALLKSFEALTIFQPSARPTR